MKALLSSKFVSKLAVYVTEAGGASICGCSSGRMIVSSCRTLQIASSRVAMFVSHQVMRDWYDNMICPGVGRGQIVGYELFTFMTVMLNKHFFITKCLSGIIKNQEEAEDLDCK
jgi:hypothetical protein